MPEGDAIRRIATMLAPLVGQTVERVLTQGLPRDLGGRTITDVHPYGKHLMVDLDDGTQLRAHLGMNGRVRLYARGEGDAAIARQSPGRLTLVVITTNHVAMWLRARTIEVSARRAPMRGVALAALGPDVLGDDFDPRVAASRAVAHGTRTIGEILLDQRVAAGIGNIWKCESLFQRGIDPRTRVSALGVEEIASIYAAARELMSAGRTPEARAAAREFAVYSKTGLPCRDCSTPIVVYRLGDPPRWTWSCPRCQQNGAMRGVSS